MDYWILRYGYVLGIAEMAVDELGQPGGQRCHLFRGQSSDYHIYLLFSSFFMFPLCCFLVMLIVFIGDLISTSYVAHTRKFRVAYDRNVHPQIEQITELFQDSIFLQVYH